MVLATARSERYLDLGIPVPMVLPGLPGAGRGRAFAWPTAAVFPLLVGGAGVVGPAVVAASGPARGASRVRPAAG